jgi:multidrug resistance efflux pump
MTPQGKFASSLGLALMLAAASASFVVSRPGGAQAVAPPQAERSLALPQRVAGVGVIEPESGLVDLSPLMPGVIASIRVHEGDRVSTGQLLVEFVNDDLKAKAAQAEAQLAIKQADLLRLRNGPLPEEIQRAEAQLREEESSLKLLQLQEARRQTLARAGAVSTEALNTASSSLGASRQRREAALRSLEILRKGARAEDLAGGEAQVRLAEQQLAEARANLAKSYIFATLDGVVLRRYLEPGEAVLGQTVSPALQIADVSRLQVRTQIDEDDIAPLRVGQSAEISGPGLGARKLKGVVTRISPRLGAKTVSGAAPAEKRDTRVLDVIVGLDPGVELPINLRVDVVIDATAATANAASAPPSRANVREVELK